MAPAIWLLTGVMFGYIMGAIPVGYVVCRLYGVDIRTVGSGRTGTTNAWRAAGLKAALPTLLGDALKGAVAIWVLQWLLVQWAEWEILPPPGAYDGPEGWTPWQWAVDSQDPLRILVLSLAGGMAVIGHNWSVFLGFKGGAGGITAAVACMALHPGAGLIVWVVGATMMYWSRIAAIGTFSVAVSSAAAFLSMAIMQVVPWTYLAFAVLVVTGIAIALRSNRARLKAGDARVVTLW